VSSKASISPIGRVNVALAGLAIRVSAVFFTLLDRTAIGRATTNTAEPSTVATKQAGRITTASVATVRGPLCSDAELDAMLPRMTASTQMVVTSLVFICLTFSDKASLVEHILGLGSAAQNGVRRPGGP